MAEIKYVDTNNVRSEEMLKKWKRIETDGVDPFAPEHVEKYIGGKILYEGTDWYVFQNDHPYEGTEIQLVIVTKKFYTTDEELPVEIWNELFVIKRILCKRYNVSGGGFIMRFGDTALSGGSVAHLHAQLIVPKQGVKVAAWFGSEKK